MDINEIKLWAKNKIESESLARQERKRIKKTAWEKQNQREGFRESFQPLISQFEKPKDDKTRNIYSQDQEMLRNQLALTEGLRANQQAITQGFNQLERLADMKELPGGEKEDEIDPDLNPVRQRKILQYNLEKTFNDDDKEILNRLGYPLPNELFGADPDEIKEIYNKVSNDAKETGNRVGALKRTKNKSEEEKMELELTQKHHKTQKEYKEILQFYLRSLQYKIRQGFKNPNQLIDRLKLLGGSIMAGNNGVVPEFTQIANYISKLDKSTAHGRTKENDGGNEKIKISGHEIKMDIDQTKKLSQDKIEADFLTRIVKRNIKRKEREKQDAREAFSEAFEVLLESQDKSTKTQDLMLDELQRLNRRINEAQRAQQDQQPQGEPDRFRGRDGRLIDDDDDDDDQFYDAREYIRRPRPRRIPAVTDRQDLDDIREQQEEIRQQQQLQELQRQLLDQCRIQQQQEEELFEQLV